MFIYKILNATIEELRIHVVHYTNKYFQNICKYVDNDTLSQSNIFSTS